MYKKGIYGATWGPAIISTSNGSNRRVWLNLRPNFAFLWAMAVVAAEADGDGSKPLDCPIIQEWMTLDAVVERAAKGRICLCNQKELCRDTVSDNHEVLGPVVSVLGILAYPIIRTYS